MPGDVSGARCICPGPILTLRLTHPCGEAIIEFEVYDAAGETVCGITGLMGRIRLPPKAWLRMVRDTMAELERRARNEGCTEMRVAGRDWSRILIGYEPYDGVPNGLRKRL